jgi:hypothetical protein
MVQHVDRVDTELDEFVFTDPDSLRQIGVEVDLPRTFDPRLAQVADLADPRIYEKQVSLNVRDRAVAEIGLEAVRGCDGIPVRGPLSGRSLRSTSQRRADP